MEYDEMLFSNEIIKMDIRSSIPHWRSLQDWKTYFLLLTGVSKSLTSIPKKYQLN